MPTGKNELSLATIQEIAEKVVARYNGSIPQREKEDVLMSILEKFLKKKTQIDKMFKGESQIKTYYIAILNRMVCEIIRKEKKHWHTMLDEYADIENTPVFYPETENSLAIKEEIKRFKTIMMLFNGEQFKIYLFAKYYYKIPVSEQEIFDYSGKNHFAVKQILHQPFPDQKSETFNKLAQVTNIVEGKSIKADAVRMWLNKQLGIILKRINFNGVSKHTPESLGILLEMQ